MFRLTAEPILLAVGYSTDNEDLLRNRNNVRISGVLQSMSILHQVNWRLLQCIHLYRYSFNFGCHIRIEHRWVDRAENGFPTAAVSNGRKKGGNVLIEAIVANNCSQRRLELPSAKRLFWRPSGVFCAYISIVIAHWDCGLAESTGFLRTVFSALLNDLVRFFISPEIVSEAPSKL